MAATPEEKEAKLKAILCGYGKMAVAFSGGVDSAFLLASSAKALGPEAVLAITAQAPNFPEDEDRYAAQLCRELGVLQVLVPVALLDVKEFVENRPERCYYCKQTLLRRIAEAASERNVAIIADGGNVDDLGDYRPGLKAVREAGVISPLAEAGFTKAEIRAGLKKLGITIWDKPAAACLASRIPYGTPIDAPLLRRVEAAEAFLTKQGFAGVRVRHHGDLARIEVQAADRSRLFEPSFAERIDARLRELGYSYVAVDLRGYRTGSLNETLGSVPRL